MSGGRRGGRREAGSSVVMALYVVLLLSLALAVVATGLLIQERETRHEAIAVRLTALADAALAETLSQLSASPYAGGVAEHEFGRGTISSEVVPGGGEDLLVVARADYAGSRREVRAEVRITVLGPVVLSWRRSQ